LAEATEAARRAAKTHDNHRGGLVMAFLSTAGGVPATKVRTGARSAVLDAQRAVALRLLWICGREIKNVSGNPISASPAGTVIWTRKRTRGGFIAIIH
jgi:hypothetical protein